MSKFASRQNAARVTARAHPDATIGMAARTHKAGKFRVTSARDVGEREADHFADLATSTTHRKSAASAPLPTPAKREFIGTAPESVDAVVSGDGKQMPETLREDMENRLGTDFSRVRIHTDTAAERSAEDIKSKAYTVGNHIVFSRGRFDPNSETGRHLLAHELTHVIQQSYAGAPAIVQRDADDGSDSWEKLSPPAKKAVEDLWDQCLWLQNEIEQAGVAGNLERTQWLNEIGFKHKARINAIDSDDKVAPAKAAFEKFQADISERAGKAWQTWTSLEERYKEEYDALLRQRTSDGAEAAKLLKDYYTPIKKNIDRGAGNWITEEDFLQLKDVLDKKRHLSTGILRNSRNRSKKLIELLDVVAEVKYAGEDADKFVPGWESRIQEELDHLARLARETAATSGFDYPREYKELRTDLDKRYRDTLKAHKPEKSVLEKGASFVYGVADAIASPFIEAAKQVVDLTQIVMHFATLGKYEPSFKSDMAKAAEQGASTSDLLKGMVTGLLETPERLYNAIRDGDWEAIGREAANLYMLAKSVKEAPELIKKVPSALARTTKALRLLKARKLAIELHEARILPQKQAALTPPKVAPATETPLYLKESPPTQGFRGESQKPATPRVDETSKPVQGFRGENQKPATPRVDETSKPVQGFRGENQKPAMPRVDETSKPVQGFRGENQKPAMPRVDETSKPVQGFRGENQKPATARTDVTDTAPTTMPRARELTSPNAPAKGPTAQRRDQAASATSKKDTQQSGPTVDERMARMERARQEKLAQDARAKELREKPENQAKKREQKEKPKEETKAEKKAQRLAQIESLQKQLAANRELQLQIYAEMESLGGPPKRALSEKALAARESRKMQLAREANANLEARTKLQESISKLEVSPYDRARAYSYSDAAGKSVVKRAAGLDEMSRKPIREPSIDHVVPVDDIVNMRGWDRLFPDEQRALLSNQRNLRLMEKGANSSKGAKSWAKWEEGRRIYGEEVVNKMVELESTLRRELQGAIIQTLLDRGVRI